ncbi:upper zone of growth plate and cartilage matrix-associated protein isoform X3 [Vanacampus margaritifer]
MFDVPKCETGWRGGERTRRRCFAKRLTDCLKSVISATFGVICVPSPTDCDVFWRLVAEQRQVLAADERRREFHEEKRNEFESYVEEVDDEQNERSRESTEQWREFHYDGMNPPYEYNRQSI